MPVEIVEADIDLYYLMASSLYLEENNRRGRDTVVILPVGPVFQYRRFVWMIKERPLDLSRLWCFFMDEYLGEARSAEEFCRLSTRAVDLLPETVAINSNTALRGAMGLVPRRALFAPPSAVFPVTLVRGHRDLRFTITEEVALPSAFGLK